MVIIRLRNQEKFYGVFDFSNIKKFKKVFNGKNCYFGNCLFELSNNIVNNNSNRLVDIQKFNAESFIYKDGKENIKSCLCATEISIKFLLRNIKIFDYRNAAELESIKGELYYVGNSHYELEQAILSNTYSPISRMRTVNKYGLPFGSKICSDLKGFAIKKSDIINAEYFLN